VAPRVGHLRIVSATASNGRRLLWIVVDPSCPKEAVPVSASFVPQPYPLFAVTLRRVENPVRFELADDEPRLVLGWLTGGADPSQPRPLDQPDVLPALAGGGPLGTPWSGPIFYEETRERAEQLAKEVAKG
jgi:hypothetical protein